MPSKLLRELRMDAASCQVADEGVPQRMKVGDAVSGDAGNTARFQIVAEHFEGSFRPRSRKQTLQESVREL